VADGRPVPILTYHSLDETGSVISTPPAVFRDQMDTFARRGFRGVALGDLLDAWSGQAALPPRPLVLTFDDAFRGVAEHAAPVLAGLGFRATVFAVAGYVGRTNDWPTQPAGVPRLPLCSWAELRALRGVAEIGGHGFDHRPLLESLEPAARAREVADSRRALEDGLGAPVTTFAYPYGVSGPLAREAVRREYRAACGVTLRRAAPRDDLHALGRIDAYYLRPPAAARAFGTPAGETYLWLRGVGRRIRGLGAAPPYRTQ
jgi:peptidoglycan/xylan/chitin deacetylase (PgdA/CDA1 family)